MMTTEDERDAYNKRSNNLIDGLWDKFDKDSEKRDQIEYYMGRAYTNALWESDKHMLRTKGVDVYTNTKTVLNSCWDAYKKTIQYMGTPRFWACPDNMVMQAATEKGTVNLEEGSEDVLWVCYVDENTIDKSVAYSTILTLLIGYGKIYQKLWENKWCKSITGADSTARMPVFTE